MEERNLIRYVIDFIGLLRWKSASSCAPLRLPLAGDPGALSCSFRHHAVGLKDFKLEEKIDAPSAAQYAASLSRSPQQHLLFVIRLSIDVQPPVLFLETHLVRK